MCVCVVWLCFLFLTRVVRPLDNPRLCRRDKFSRNSCLSRSCFMPHSGSSYTESMVEQMRTLCAKYALHQVSFPVRACFAEDSTATLSVLLESDPNFSLTLWTGKMDIFNRRKLESKLDLSRVFVDFSNFADKPDERDAFGC